MRNLNLILIVFLLSPAVIFGQSKLHLFVGPGAAYYQGDVSQTGLPDPRLIRFNVKAGVGYDFSPRWGLRLHGSMGTLTGNDAYTGHVGKIARGVSFNTSIIDAGLTVKINGFMNNELHLDNYMFFGVDYMNMKVTNSYSGTTPLAPETAYSPHQINFPVGIGVGYWFNPFIGLFYEGSLHLTTTDYLDGLKYGGNPTAPDTYFDSHLLLVVRFGKFKLKGKDSFGNADCPRF